MNRLQGMVAMVLAVGLVAGGSAAFAKGKKHQGSLPVDTQQAGAPKAGAKKPHHPHGIVTAVGDGSITIEKVKKLKTKTYKLSSSVTVEKKGHGKKAGKNAGGGSTGTISDVKVGDHVRLYRSGKEVVKILDKGKGKSHKHAKGASGGAQSKGI